MEDVVSIITKKEEVKMPRGNKTGPEGFGPLTGRHMGFCAGYETAGFQNNAGLRRSAQRVFGRGQHFRTFGRGFAPMQRNFFASENIPVNQEAFLKNEISVLRNQLSILEEQLEKLSKKD